MKSGGRARTIKTRSAKVNAAIEAAQAEAAKRRSPDPAGLPDPRDTVALHRVWVEQFADTMIGIARDAFVRQGRGAICVPFDSITGSLQGGHLDASVLPLPEVLAAVQQATPDRLDSIREMLDGYDPASQFVLVLFDHSGDLHPYRIRVNPPETAPPARIDFRLPGATPRGPDGRPDDREGGSATDQTHKV